MSISLVNFRWISVGVGSFSSIFRFFFFVKHHNHQQNNLIFLLFRLYKKLIDYRKSSMRVEIATKMWAIGVTWISYKGVELRISTQEYQKTKSLMLITSHRIIYELTFGVVEMRERWKKCFFFRGYKNIREWERAYKLQKCIKVPLDMKLNGNLLIFWHLHDVLRLPVWQQYISWLSSQNS